MLARGARLLMAPTLVAAVLGGLTFGGDRRATASGGERPTLGGISSRLEGALGPVLIEATKPVPYVTSQPDPPTVLVDLRNVRSNRLDAPPRTGPTRVRAVPVEHTTATDSVPTASVHVNLERSATHRVRSTRNVMPVKVDRGNAAQPATSAAATPNSERRQPAPLPRRHRSYCRGRMRRSSPIRIRRLLCRLG